MQFTIKKIKIQKYESVVRSHNIAAESFFSKSKSEILMYNSTLFGFVCPENSAPFIN